MTQAREAQRRAEMFAEALQSRINGLTTDVVNRDDPYQRAKLADDRQKALAELQRVPADIRTSEEGHRDIEKKLANGRVPRVGCAEVPRSQFLAP
jgi:hypothetical protein